VLRKHKGAFEWFNHTVNQIFIETLYPLAFSKGIIGRSVFGKPLLIIVFLLVAVLSIPLFV